MVQTTQPTTTRTMRAQCRSSKTVDGSSMVWMIKPAHLGHRLGERIIERRAIRGTAVKLQKLCKVASDTGCLWVSRDRPEQLAEVHRLCIDRSIPYLSGIAIRNHHWRMFSRRRSLVHSQPAIGTLEDGLFKFTSLLPSFSFTRQIGLHISRNYKEPVAIT
jgi:hypothetical protein